jgi:hypothetical protein
MKPAYQRYAVKRPIQKTGHILGAIIQYLSQEIEKKQI